MIHCFIIVTTKYLEGILNIRKDFQTHKYTYIQ